jgi:hypothetical protein
LCSIVAANYLAYAKVLIETIRANNPGSEISLLVVDRDRQTLELGDLDVEILSPSDIVHEPGLFTDMTAMYDVRELCTAVKPWLLRHLLERDSVVAYLDPDIAVYAALDHLKQYALAHSIVLTPHVTEPVPRDGLQPSEEDLLAAGMFNLGFIAVSQGAIDFLDWWKGRLARDCIVDIGHGLFVDQRWVDLGAQCFDHFVLRDTTCNVAFWNLHSRTVGRSSQGFTVNGRPLTFFHFSGLPLHETSTLNKYWTERPRVTVEPGTPLEELCHDYRRRVRDALAQVPCPPYPFDVAVSGTPLSATLRRAFRAELLGGRHPPDPFDRSEIGAFERWAASVHDPHRSSVRARLRQVARAAAARR